jgi:hypothetical protein
VLGLGRPFSIYRLTHLHPHIHGVYKYDPQVDLAGRLGPDVWGPVQGFIPGEGGGRGGDTGGVGCRKPAMLDDSMVFNPGFLFRLQTLRYIYCIQREEK